MRSYQYTDLAFSKKTGWFEITGNTPEFESLKDFLERCNDNNLVPVAWAPVHKYNPAGEGMAIYLTVGPRRVIGQVIEGTEMGVVNPQGMHETGG